MIDTDLAFKKSEVEAHVTTKVDSIKNPLSGRIQVPEVGELLMDDKNAKGEVLICGQKNSDGICRILDKAYEMGKAI